MNSVQEKPQLLEDRTLEFSVEVINFCRSLPKSNINDILCSQLIRSATSIGANYAEANNASSRQDFKNKIFIAKKEAAETRYWLKLAEKVNDGVDISGALDEISQLIFIFQKISSTLKNGK
ncbi:MAG TPA: four helix bundle protein [Candidatus Saccharimonadales bacterium]|nr:four helix bundle protein [Candidatus Saccharimonadales bacterium]